MSEEAEIITEHYVDKLIEKMGEIITEDEGLTVGNISSIMLSMMVIIDQYPDLSGSQKKEIILATLKKYIFDNFEQESTECRDLLHTLEKVLPNIINLMVSLDRGEVAIHLKKISAMICLCPWKAAKKQKA